MTDISLNDYLKEVVSVDFSDSIFSAYSNARNSLIPHISQSRLFGRSDYWSREVLSMDYLLDANPAILMRLREHCHWVTGVHPYQYSTHHQNRPEKDNLATRLEQLRQRNHNLIVQPERENYGGFGFRIEEKLYNVDTLKYHEVLIGINERVTHKNTGTLRAVIEVGSGFGGLADVLVRSMSGLRMILVDLPEVLLLAGTFLGAWHKDSRIKFVKSVQDLETYDLEDFDFLLVPNYLINDTVRFRFKIDMLLNTVSFQEMTSAEVHHYVEFAYRNQIDRIYSLNRDVSTYNSQLDSVREQISKRYRLEELEILETEYTSALKSPKKLKKRNENPYRHVLGVLR